MQNKKWIQLRKGADFKGISEQYHISPVLARIIRNRDVVGDNAIEEYLYGNLSFLGDGMQMKDMEKAVTILAEKIHVRAHIRIIGDYDIDGVNATYVLLKGLEGAGGSVDTDIPDRLRDGYGLNRHLIERALGDGVDTLITCDNGIAAAEEIAYGREQGMTIIVTDHHEVPYEGEADEKKYHLPPANAVIDPKQEDCAYPFKGLCGAAVAYKVMDCLYRHMGKDTEGLTELLGPVAFATIGDVMDLVGENRTLVRLGMEQLRHTQNQGLLALMECTGISPAHLSAYHIGFVLGPCLNASGRLDSAKRALDLLCAEERREAEELAGNLKALNDSRKEMTEKALQNAVEQVESTDIQEDPVYVIYLPDCHESLAGIVAGRIREQYYHPVFVLTGTGSTLKGSGRSIPTYSMYEGLSACQELLQRFGGHRLAAGLSMEASNLESFRRKINENAGLTGEDLTERLTIDMELPFGYVTQELVQELKLLEPCGKANPKPVFALRNVEVLSTQMLGKSQRVLRMRLRDSYGTQMSGVFFGQAQTMQERLEANRSAGKRSTFAYYPDINEYGGNRTLQVIVKDVLIEQQ